MDMVGSGSALVVGAPPAPVDDDAETAGLAPVLDACASFATLKPHAAVSAAEDARRLAAAAEDILRRWALEICFHLEREEVLRFNQLRRRLAGISTRTLAERLERLARLGFVQRVPYLTIPPRVDYRLTLRGRALVLLLRPALRLLARAIEHATVSPAKPGLAGPAAAVM